MSEQQLAPSICDALGVMLAQREKGIANYGMAVESANLTLAQWIRHAQEEVADSAVYLSMIDRTAGAILTKLDELSTIVPMGDTRVLGLITEIRHLIVSPTPPPAEQQALELDEPEKSYQLFGDGTMNVRVNGRIERRNFRTVDGVITPSVGELERVVRAGDDIWIELA